MEDGYILVSVAAADTLQEILALSRFFLNTPAVLQQLNKHGAGQGVSLYRCHVSALSAAGQHKEKL